MEKELLFKNRILELSRAAYERNIVLFTDFLNLNELHIVNNLNFKHSGVSCRMFGGYKMSERQIAAFIPDALSFDYQEPAGLYIPTAYSRWKYPLTCLEVRPLSAKLSETLNHRDYLGALLNLGIERSTLGDIVFQEQTAYVFCVERMKDFITEQLTRIRHTQVLAKEIEFEAGDIVPEFETINGTVASVRLDAVIGTAFNTSRSSMIGLIEGGKVFVNGKIIVSNGYTLKADDIVSVRGHGKFQFCGSESKTKKGRCRIQINRYI